MKKTYLMYIAYLLITILIMGVVSCGDDDNEEPNNPSNPEKPINPVDPTKDNAMSPTEQKEYLEKVALDLMKMMPESDFRDIAELGNFIDANYRDYEWDSVNEWAKSVFNAAREALGTKTRVSETETWESYTYIYNYIYTNYKAVLLASNFTGHFTANNGRWIQEKANDLQFIFTDKRGQQCNIKLETSGSVKKVYLLDDDEWTGYDYNHYDNSYINNEYYDRTQYIIGVPEKIVVTLTQGSSQIVKTSIKIDLENITNEEFDISKNSLTLTTLVELNNGYKVDVSKIAYTANTKASVAFTMRKNGTALVTIGAAADVNDIPSVNVRAFFSERENLNNYDFDKASAKNSYVKTDILGKIQIQGTLFDIRKYVDYIREANHHNSDEKTFKSYINMANSLADVNLFFDGNNIKQANVKLEPFADETWKGRTYWEEEPVLYFYDGSSYSTFKVFFNEIDFKNTIDAFETLINKYADLVGEHIGW